MNTNPEYCHIEAPTIEVPHSSWSGRRKAFTAVTNFALSTSVALGMSSAVEEEPIDVTFTHVSNEVGSTKVTNPAPEDSYIVSTYNIMGSQFPSPYSLVTRMSGVTSIINGQDNAPKSDIVSLQEVMTGKNQYGMLKNKLGNKGYALYPSAERMRSNVIAYDKDRFRLLSAGLVPYPFYEDSRRGGRWEMSGRAAWVYLEDKKTDAKIATIGARFVAWNTDPGSDRGGAQKRKYSAETLQEWAVDFQKNHPKAIVTVANDDNAVNYLRDKFGVNWTTDNPDVRHKDDVLRSRAGLPYCRQTAEPNYLQNTKDSVYGMFGTCPDTVHSGKIHDNMKNQRANWSLSRRNQITIDAVYYSPQTAAAADWDQNVTANGRKSSDHHLLWTKLVARDTPIESNVRTIVLGEQTRLVQ